MAPMPASSYFPPLDKCLNGEQLILSWKSLLDAITNGELDAVNGSSAIDQFFSDSEVLDRLSKPFDAFPEPSSQAKSVFEQKTSAINVTPSTDSRYDIKEIKEDALWLSSTAKVDEVSALRIVVGECQSRPAAQLLGPFCNEEITSLQEASGNAKYSSDLVLAALPQGLDAKQIKSTFDSQDARRQRIVLTYLSERRHLLKCAELLIRSSRSVHSYVAQSRKGKGTDPPASLLQNIGSNVEQRLGNQDALFMRATTAIKSNLRNMESPSGWFGEAGFTDSFELEWTRSQITEITHVMEIMFEIIDRSETVTSSQVILEWLRLLQTCDFFDNFETEDPTILALSWPLQSLATVISLAVFNVGSCVEFLNDYNTNVEVSDNAPIDQPYIINSQTIPQVHAMLLNASESQHPTIGPAFLAWGIILQSMTFRVREFKTLQIESHPNNRYDRQGSVDTDITVAPVPYEQVMEQIMDHAEDPVDLLARRAVNDYRTFDLLSNLALRLGTSSTSFFSHITGARMRLVIWDLLQSTSSSIGYMDEVIEATLSVLTGGQTYWDVVGSTTLPMNSDPIMTFLQEGEQITSFFKNAMDRYPFESLPFLKMAHALASSPNSYLQEDSPSVLAYLENIPTFTLQLPEDFVDYETFQEEDNNNNIRLTYPIEMFSSRSRSIAYQTGSLALTRTGDNFSIAAGTNGRIISDSDPKIAFWYHGYSGIKYFGKLLETFMRASDQVDGTTGLPAGRESVSEIISMFAAILLGMSKSANVNTNSKADAIRVLQTASSGLDRNRDIITLVFAIFEEELQKQSAYSGADVPLEVLTSCTHFIHALLPSSPRRVWPLLAQSSFLGVGRGGSRLAAIVQSVEVISGRYDFLLSCCHLYAALVEDIVANAIRRKSGAKSSARFVDGEDFETGVQSHILSKTLLSYTRYLAEVLESSCSWKFANPSDKRQLVTAITTAFDNVLRYTYGTESSSNGPSVKIVEILSPAASHIVDSFLSTTSGTLRFLPLFHAYVDGLETPDFTTLLPLINLWKTQLVSTLAFSKTLLRVSLLLERATSQLETQIFKSSPLLARLYAANDTYRTPVVQLFESLILAASHNTSEPPSLLGYLGPATAKNFLNLLSYLDKPLSRDSHVLPIWHFFSIVVSKRQQWFANYILTGKTPRDALQNHSSSKDLNVLDKPLLTTALEKLSKIDNVSHPENSAMLEFVTLAQNFWPWTVYESKKYEEFIRNISEFIGNLEPVQPGNKFEAVLKGCYQTRVAAYIAELLAMHLFHTRQTGTASPLKDFLSDISYYSRFAVAAPSYNSSLHGNLKHNFETQYSGLKLRDLKRSNLEDRLFGKDYFYDVSLAEKMLSLDKGWIGKSDNGFRNEIKLANVNLSLVDAQINLFQNWKFLAIELSRNLKDDPKVQEMLAKVAHDCLITNSRSQLPEDIFVRLSETRANFALVLTQRLVEAKSDLPVTKKLLDTTWENIKVLRGSFESVLDDSNADYYRSLLKLLFLSLRAHADSTSPISSENLRASIRTNQIATLIPTIMEILKNVVANGLREVAASIHDSAETSTPEDVALLTGILQSILRIPGIELAHTQIVSLFASQSTARVATTLFSWSDSLAINGDPIYGELSILFLLELSSIPTMAEQLAVDGLLGHIGTANIASYLRRGHHVHPFAESAGLQRCYSIWVRGILPLLLNLLDAVQASSIATEVSNFLSQFPLLITQACHAFSPPESSYRPTLTNQNQTQKSQLITVITCSELHSLALIMHILQTFRQQPGGSEIPIVQEWDAGQVSENIEFWLGSRGLLRDRLVAIGDREAEWSKRPAVNSGSGTAECKSLLEERVVGELLGVRDVLNGGE